MDFELERRRALPLLRRLRSELATHGCSVAMLDSRPCLTVATHHLQASLSILVDATATHFTWTNGKHRHPVDDVPCAVLAIVVCIRCRERASDEPVHIRAPDDRQPHAFSGFGPSDDGLGVNAEGRSDVAGAQQGSGNNATAERDVITRARLNALGAALTAYGLHVRIGTDALTVRNPTPRGKDTSPNPGRYQAITPAPDHSGILTWHWAWIDPDNDARLRTRPIAPADEIDATAASVARALGSRARGRHRNKPQQPDLKC